MVTSSGTRSSSSSERVKSKSAFDAAGKPTSISLKPSPSRSAKSRRLRAGSIGLASAWLPSRRSVEHQIGARSSTTFGHVRSGRSTVSYGRYLWNGIGTAGAPSDGRDAGVPRLRDGYVQVSLPLAGKREERAEGVSSRGLVHHERNVRPNRHGTRGKSGQSSVTKL